MLAVAIAIDKKVNVVLTGYCSPIAEKYLSNHGIEVLTGWRGDATSVLETYLQKKTHEENTHKRISIDRSALASAFKNATDQFAKMLPILLGVVLLMGLFHVFVPRKMLLSVFSGNPVLDTLWGACFGSILAGNPVNSYIIGAELLAHGVSLFAVTAIIISWVSVGLIQLPAEITALGRRFALIRNGLSFVLSVLIAFSTVLILALFRGLCC
jgi:uncharacterized membrane protein YraQ (UPF0718 family)